MIMKCSFCKSEKIKEKFYTHECNECGQNIKMKDRRALLMSFGLYIVKNQKDYELYESVANTIDEFIKTQQ